MAVKIRLFRAGSTKKPFYRIVVSNSESPRNGRFIEIIGTYDPAAGMEKAQINAEQYKAWVGKGAVPSETVRNIAKNLNI